MTSIAKLRKKSHKACRKRDKAARDGDETKYQKYEAKRLLLLDRLIKEIYG